MLIEKSSIAQPVQSREYPASWYHPQHCWVSRTAHVTVHPSDVCNWTHGIHTNLKQIVFHKSIAIILRLLIFSLMIVAWIQVKIISSINYNRCYNLDVFKGIQGCTDAFMNCISLPAINKQTSYLGAMPSEILRVQLHYHQLHSKRQWTSKHIFNLNIQSFWFCSSLGKPWK